MSRNSSGTYSLPAGNPVQTATTITSSWANSTLNDLANALTDSLSRSGQGGMQAGLPLFDGTSGLPGLTWANELTSGLFRNAAGDFRWVISTTEQLRLTSLLATFAGKVTIGGVGASGVDTQSLNIVSTFPSIQLRDTDAAANHQMWTISGNGGALQIHLRSDDGVSTITSVLIATRIDNVLDYVDICATEGRLLYGGVEVGYRNLPETSFSADATLDAASRGTLRRYTGSGGHTLNINNGVFSGDEVITVLNAGGGALTLGGTISSLSWFNGSGTISTGNRSLAVGGVVTIWLQSSNAAYVWGAGLS